MLFSTTCARCASSPCTLHSLHAHFSHARPQVAGCLTVVLQLLSLQMPLTFLTWSSKIPISALATTESASAEGTVRLQFKEGKSLNMPALLVKNATSKLVPFAPFIKAGYWILATEQGALVIDKDTHETLTFAPADSEGMYWLLQMLFLEQAIQHTQLAPLLFPCKPQLTLFGMHG